MLIPSLKRYVLRVSVIALELQRDSSRSLIRYPDLSGSQIISEAGVWWGYPAPLLDRALSQALLQTPKGVP